MSTRSRFRILEKVRFAARVMMALSRQAPAVVAATVTLLLTMFAAPRCLVAQGSAPEIEDIRVHHRVTPSSIEWPHRTIAGPGGVTVDVVVPPGLEGPETDVVIHFHGPAWLLHSAVQSLVHPVVSSSVNTSGLSSAYSAPFASPDAFDDLLAEVRETASDVRGDDVRIRRVVLSGFSAGYGAIRAILEHPPHRDRVDAVLLLDGMHAGWIEDDDASGQTINPKHMAAFVEFARDALAGEKRFLITHSAIRTEGYASTTETAQYVMSQLGLERNAAAAAFWHRMDNTSAIHSFGLAILGFTGDTAADHIDHLHVLPDALAKLLGLPEAQ